MYTWGEMWLYAPHIIHPRAGAPLGRCRGVTSPGHQPRGHDSIRPCRHRLAPPPPDSVTLRNARAQSMGARSHVVCYITTFQHATRCFYCCVHLSTYVKSSHNFTPVILKGFIHVFYQVQNIFNVYLIAEKPTERFSQL